MVAKLVIEEGDLKGLSLSLEDGDEKWTIGRDPDTCQLVIEDPLVSRQHLVVRRTPEGLMIENLSTTNPVQINDEEMGEKSSLLQNGDTLKVGNEVLRYYEDSSAHILDEGTPEDEMDEITEEESQKNEMDLTGIEAIRDIIKEVKEEEPAEAIDRSFSEDSFSEEIEPSPSEEGISYDEGIPLSQTEEEISAQEPIPEEEETVPSPAAHTIFAEEEADIGPLANIDFGVVETGRWLLKVIGGPNTGAEFYMQPGNSYLIGTDPHTCDIVFNDTSVSRQHSRITISPEDTIIIEDLRSRNGVLIDGTAIEHKQPLPLNTIVTLGTTSFVVYDREGEMQTIISPLLPSIVKVLQQEPPKAEEVAPISPLKEESLAESAEAAPVAEVAPPKPKHSFANFIILATVVALFALAGLGTSSLFKSEPVVTQTQENADELIQSAMKPFPALRYTFNKNTGAIFLLGHIMNLAEKNQLLFNLQSLKFIKSIDDTGIIIDESVWYEVNSILAENPAWKGISIYSPTAGQFILSGYLQTRKQAEQLTSYISLNFPYLDLLKKQIVVEEDVVNQANTWLQNAQLFDITAKMSNGELTLTGGAPPDKTQNLNEVIGKIKHIPGIRIVNNLVKAQSSEPNLVNISDHYPVTGKSRIGNKFTVVINGRILSEGDDLDGMMITQITNNRVMLEKDNVKYRIDY